MKSEREILAQVKSLLKEERRGSDVRNAAVFTWRYIIDRYGGRAEQSYLISAIRNMALRGQATILEPVELFDEWKKAGWIEYSPNESEILITPTGVEQLKIWEKEDRKFGTDGAHEKIRSLLDDVADLKEENGVKVRNLVRRAEMIITQIFGKSSIHLAALRQIKFHGLPYDSIAGRDKGGPFRRGKQAFTDLCKRMLENLGPESKNVPQQATVAHNRFAPGQSFGQWTLKGDKPLGKGGNGIVWLVENKEGKQGAIKFFDRHGLEKRFDKSQIDSREKRFRDEIEFQEKESGRRGILPLIDSSFLLTPPKMDSLWFVTPLAVPFTTLKFSGTENLVNLVRLMEVISQTLAALHEQEKWHRDLHPGNLFLLDGKPVVGDFGLVDFPGKESVTGDTEQIGARNFVAPEMRENAGQTRADKADVFSFAKTFWVLATGKPFPPDGPLEKGTRELRLSTYCQHENAYILDSLMERSTAFDPARRPTMKDFSKELVDWLNIGLVSTPPTSDLKALITECRNVLEPAIIAEANQTRIILEAKSILASFDGTLERMSTDMMKITNITPRLGDTILYERFHIFPQHLGQAKVIWRGAREVRITTYLDPIEIFIHGYVQVEGLSDNRVRILVGYLAQPTMRGQLIIVPDSWKDESIAGIGSVKLINEMNTLKVELLEKLPQAIREYITLVNKTLWHPRI